MVVVLEEIKCEEIKKYFVYKKVLFQLSFES